MTTKAEKLAHYAGRDLKRFYQFDGWLDSDTQSIGSEAPEMCGGYTHELMRGTDVRILVPDGASIPETLALLKKMVGWIERDYVPSGLPISTRGNETTATSAMREAMRILERDEADRGCIPF